MVSTYRRPCIAGLRLLPGGKDNFAADRSVAEEIIAVRPTIIRDIRANRAFLGRALVTSSPHGACAYLDADLKDTAKILAEAAQTLDFSQPVAVLFVGVLHLVSDDEDPYGIVADMVNATVPGSYLALTHPAKDINADEVAEGARRYNEHVKVRQTRRTYEETLRCFDGLQAVPPGLVQCHRWRPDPGPPTGRRTCRHGGGVARK